MAAKQTNHPTIEQLRAFALGQMDGGDSQAIEQHVEHCDDCCQVVGSVADDPLLKMAQMAAADTSQIGETLFAATPTQKNSPAIPEDLRNHPKYEVLELIGQGGMGAVFKARHRLMDRLVAIKVIHPKLVDNPTAVERFQREAKTAASLRHPNIVTALDAEQVGETHLLVMDFVDGQPLDEVIRAAGKLPVQQSCEIAKQIAEGLQHAAQSNMVHRDIKPQNIMLAADGTAKILDLGLARFASEQSANQTNASAQSPSQPEQRDHKQSEQTTRLTGEHVILGSPDYIAPEQIDSAKDADIRADIYSLGGTMYAMLCGHAPFPAGSTMDKFAHHKMSQPESICSQRDDVPLQLQNVIERMMAKSPGERPQEPQQVVAALDDVLVQIRSDVPVVDVNAAVGESKTDGVAKKKSLNPIADSKKSPSRLKKNRKLNGKIIGFSLAGFAALVALCMALSGLFNKPNVPVGSSDDARVLILIPRTDFWGPDFHPVRETLQTAGVEVDVGSTSVGECTPMEKGAGLPVEASVAMSDADADRYDAIVFMGWDIAAFRPSGVNGNDVAALISAIQEKDGWVTSLCAGNVVLAEHGVLSGKEAATGPHVQQAGAQPDQALWTTTKAVTVSGRVITGRDDKNAVLFAKTLLDNLNKN